MAAFDEAVVAVARLQKGMAQHCDELPDDVILAVCDQLRQLTRASKQFCAATVVCSRDEMRLQIEDMTTEQRGRLYTDALEKAFAADADEQAAARATVELIEEVMLAKEKEPRKS